MNGSCELCCWVGGGKRGERDWKLKKKLLGVVSFSLVQMGGFGGLWVVGREDDDLELKTRISRRTGQGTKTRQGPSRTTKMSRRTRVRWPRRPTSPTRRRARRL